MMFQQLLAYGSSEYQQVYKASTNFPWLQTVAGGFLGFISFLVSAATILGYFLSREGIIILEINNPVTTLLFSGAGLVTGGYAMYEAYQKKNKKKV